MKSLAIRCCAAAALALSCGDNLKGTPGDGPDGIDAPSFPAAPALGAQIDRMARPAINTALIGAFLDPDAVAAMKQDNYSAASDPLTWKTTPVAPGRTIAAEMAINLAIIDVLDQGDIVTNPPPARNGCGNQVLYNGGGGGAPGPTSYAAIAGILADDMLYVDTKMPKCTAYLSLEVEYATAGGIIHSHCGGRAPTNDVIDTSYSALAVGLNGFMVTAEGEFLPKYIDGAVSHADVSDTVFPYFGAPH